MQSRSNRPALVAAILLILLAVSPSLQAQAEEPWKFLQDFSLIRGAVSPVKDGYVGAVLHNSEKRLFALVIYPGVCRGQSCTVESPVAYFVIDTKGLLVRHHVKPGGKVESMIGDFQIS